MSQFYLQDSRSNTGDGLMFWALGDGYTTNLDKAELFTQEQACDHRETDIPWPKAYVDARAHLGVEHQYISLDEARDQLSPGCTVVLQIPSHWNGNDIALAHWPIGHTYRFEKAHRLIFEAAQAIGNTPEEAVIWPVAYLEAKARRLVHKRDVDIKEALTGTGIVLTKAKRRAPASIQTVVAAVDLCLRHPTKTAATAITTTAPDPPALPTSALPSKMVGRVTSRSYWLLPKA